MNVLDNELVRKYFGCQHKANGRNLLCDCVAGDAPQKILDAMQQPIREGERYLYLGYTLNFQEQTSKSDWDTQFHPLSWRLPDRFQKKEHAAVPPHLSENCMPECRYWVVKSAEKLQPAPEPKKCDHDDFNKGDHCTICKPGFVLSKTMPCVYCKSGVTHCGRPCKPSDAVETKIQDIAIGAAEGYLSVAQMDTALRELVRLARERL